MLLKLASRKDFFFGQAFELYGGVSGLFDYGPIGCMLKTNIIEQWRKHFVVSEDMLEIEATMMTPSKVLEASGHAERFADLMVKDLKTGECFRADHLLESFIEKELNEKNIKDEFKLKLKKLNQSLNQCQKKI
jgi:glycyl-tRNA synthetase